MYSCIHVLVREEDKLDTLTGTLEDNRVCPIMFPNITTIMNILLLTSVTASGSEWANSSLRFIKDTFRSTMGEDRFNALIFTET